MSAARLLLAALVVLPCLWPDTSGILLPAFSTDSIVNAANNRAAWLAPNALATIYGTNLSYSTAQVTPSSLGQGSLPFVLGGVRVFVSDFKAPLVFVSPTQINFLIPGDLLPGPATVRVDREGVTAPATRITLLETAPALFQIGPAAIAATHADGSLITPETPARSGDFAILYGTGLGRTIPDQDPGRISYLAAPIRRFSDFRVLLDGVAVPVGNVTYAGASPGFPGLYQVNVRLPAISGTPELRIAIGEQSSQSALQLPVE